MISHRIVSVAALTLAMSVSTGHSLAQGYPAKPVRMVVPFAPGGPTDACARLIAQMLSERTGQRFYTENVTGAGGNIGTGQAAKAQPDGYTALITVNSHVMNPMLYDRVPYDPFRDFAPVALAATFGSVLAVNPSVPASTVNELVALIKSGSVKYSFGSPGAGTPSHLVGEQFRLSLGLDLVHVPYSGGGPAITSVVAGHTPIAFAALSAAVPQAKAGKLRVLALMEQDPLAIASGRAYDRRSRLSGPRRRRLGWHSRPGRHAETDRRHASSRDRRDRRHAGGQDASHGARVQFDRRGARRIHGAHEARDWEVGQGDPIGWHQA